VSPRIPGGDATLVARDLRRRRGISGSHRDPILGTLRAASRARSNHGDANRFLNASRIARSDHLDCGFGPLEEPCVRTEDCEFGAFDPADQALCAEICTFPQRDGSLRCRLDLFASGELCDPAESLVDGRGVPVGPPKKSFIVGGSCESPGPLNSDLIELECGDLAIPVGSERVLCPSGAPAFAGECSHVKLPDFEAQIAAGIDQGLALLLFERDRDVLELLDDLLRNETPNFTDEQRLTAFWGSERVHHRSLAVRRATAEHSVQEDPRSVCGASSQASPGSVSRGADSDVFRHRSGHFGGCRPQARVEKSMAIPG